MRSFATLLLFVAGLANVATAAPYADRLVWVFGWNLDSDGDVAEVTKVLDAAGKAGLNGAVVTFGLDTLCKKTPAFFQRLGQVQQVCERSKLGAEKGGAESPRAGIQAKTPLAQTKAKTSMRRGFAKQGAPRRSSP